jgi:Phosphofructokinase
VPKTIDNDLCGTDTTIGFTTAYTVVTEAVDRLHSTAESHDMIHIIEVMGRNTGWIALRGGMAGGADIIPRPPPCASRASRSTRPNSTSPEIKVDWLWAALISSDSPRGPKTDGLNGGAGRIRTFGRLYQRSVSHLNTSGSDGCCLAVARLPVQQPSGRGTGGLGVTPPAKRSPSPALWLSLPLPSSMACFGIWLYPLWPLCLNAMYDSGFLAGF